MLLCEETENSDTNNKNNYMVKVIVIPYSI